MTDLSVSSVPCAIPKHKTVNLSDNGGLIVLAADQAPNDPRAVRCVCKRDLVADSGDREPRILESSAALQLLKEHTKNLVLSGVVPHDSSVSSAFYVYALSQNRLSEIALPCPICFRLSGGRIVGFKRTRLT